MLPFLRQQRVEGLLIIYHGSEDDTYRLLAEIPRSIPVVTTGYAQDRDNVVSVKVDTRTGAREATEHLIRLGHERIALVTGAPRAYETVQRNAGYRAALDAAGIPFRDELVEAGDWFVESGYDAMRLLFSRSSAFTAVFAHSDRMAVGCIRAVLDHGLRVPEDIAVVGFNDISLARYVSPPLTTVHYPLYELGQICTRLLIARVDSSPAAELGAIQAEAQDLRPGLVVRQSCGGGIR